MIIHSDHSLRPPRLARNLTTAHTTMLTILSLAAALGVAPAAQADSISGAWQIKGDVQGNPLNQVCTIKRTADSLSGSCTSEAGLPVPVAGQVKDGKITFQHGGDYQGTALTIIYSGTLAAPKELKGTVDVQPFGVGGTFTATPAPAQSPAKP